MDQQFIDLYNMRTAEGLSRVPAAKAALGLDADRPPSLRENDDIQALIEAAEKEAAMMGRVSINQVRAEYIAPEHDPINYPSHYTSYKNIEVIQLVEQMNFNRGNAVKYLARAGKKPSGNELEDLRKARWYLNREIERMESDADA